MQRDIAGEHADSAAHADAWKYGGGSIYATPVIDAARHLLIFGTGNPSPQMADASRPGDNLYTSSLVALDLRTGKMVWHYQQVPHDRWGYDVASSPVLLDVTQDGKRIPAVAQASKTGWVFVHDRRDGTLLFKSDAFVPQRNLFTPPQPGEGVVIAPGIAGGANWSPSAYDPRQHLFFVGALHLPTRYIAHEVRRPGQQRDPVRQHAEHRRGLGHAQRARPGPRREARVAGEDRGAARSVACSPPRAGWCSPAPARECSAPSTVRPAGRSGRISAMRG